MLGYLGFLSLVMLGMYAGWLTQHHNSGASSVAQLGMEIYAGIYVTQIFLVLFITPAITSGAITIEREQQTDAMLAMTRLPSRSIIAGKLLSAVAFTGLLLVTSLPLVSLCFTMGGVDAIMVMQSYLMMLAGSVMVGAMGLMWSSIAKTTTQAVMYTYMSLMGAACVIYAGFGYSQWSGFDGNNIAATIFHALGDTWFGGKAKDGLSVSSFGFTILCGLLGWIMAAVAMSRIETWPERKGGLLRSLTALAVGLQLLAVYHWWGQAWGSRGDGNETQYAIQSPLAALTLPAGLLMILATIFCTGEFAPHELRDIGKTIQNGWKPGQLKRGVAASGMPFMLLLTLFSLGVFAASGLLAASNGNDFIGAGLVMLTAVFGFGMFCQFLSALLKNRWAAWLFASITLGLLWIFPAMSLINSDAQHQPGLCVNLFYLNPAFIIARLSSPDNAWSYALSQRVTNSTESLILSAFGWVVIAAASLIGTHWIAGFSTKRAAVKAAEATA